MPAYTITDTSRDFDSAFSTEAESPQAALEEFAQECGYSSMSEYHLARGTTPADIVVATDTPEPSSALTIETPGLTDARSRRRHRRHQALDTDAANPAEAERRAAFARCRAGSASDEDRALLATRKGNTMLGPIELQRCSKHPRNTEAFRWYWDAPGPGEDPLQAVTYAEAEFVRGCSKCENEQQERDLYDWDE